MVFLLLKQKGIDIQPQLFEKCTIINNLELNETIESIKQYASANFNQLKSITLPSSMTIIEDGAFLNCETLIEVIVPSSINMIGDQAFKNCVNLKYFEFSSSITSIGKSSFKNCKRIAKWNCFDVCCKCRLYRNCSIISEKR